MGRNQRRAGGCDGNGCATSRQLGSATGRPKQIVVGSRATPTYVIRTGATYRTSEGVTMDHLILINMVSRREPFYVGEEGVVEGVRSRDKGPSSAARTRRWGTSSHPLMQRAFDSEVRARGKLGCVWPARQANVRGGAPSPISNIVCPCSRLTERNKVCVLQGLTHHEMRSATVGNHFAQQRNCQCALICPTVVPRSIE